MDFLMPPPASCARSDQCVPSAHSAWQPRNQGQKDSYLTDPLPISATGTTAPATAALAGSGFIFPGSSVDRLGIAEPPPSRSYRGAVPWTSSETGDPFVDGGEDVNMPESSRHLLEYNSLADKYGLPPLSFGDDAEEFSIGQDSQTADTRGWFARAFGKPPASVSRRSSRQSAKSDKSSKHKRSESDTTVLGQNSKADQQRDTKDTKDALKHETLQSLVRLCGKSLLYLPSGYATRSLTLPTCIRAAAQYLVQNGPETRGVFRISGSTRVVGELYDYYCVNIDEADISTTVRSPNLPFHIHCSVHDVASLFKRLLAGLPGGVLGHVSLFEALVNIYRMLPTGSQGSNMADRDLVRARLIALAVGSVPSPLQRELICAVFGILCLIGRAAEAAAARGDVYNSRMPNSELMGFSALGIIFGPLLLGDHLSFYSSDTSDDAISSFFLPQNFTITPSPRSRTDRRRKSTTSDKRSLIAASLTLDKVLLANNIAEMLVKSWTLVVQQMDSMAIMRKQSLTQRPPLDDQLRIPRALRPSRSETFSDTKQPVAVPPITSSHRSNSRATRSSSVSLIRSNTTHVAVGSQQPPPWPLFGRTAEKTPEGFASRIGSALSGQSAVGSVAAAVRNISVKQAVAALSPSAELARAVGVSSGSSASKSARLPSRVQNNASPPLDSGMIVPSWRAKLKPVDTSAQYTDTTTGNARSPLDRSPRRMPQNTSATSSRRSSSGALSGSDGSPSKTAALIARIINPRTTAAPVVPQSMWSPERGIVATRTEKSIASTGRVTALATMPWASPDGSVFSESRKKWLLQANASPSTAKDYKELAQLSATTQNGRWRARTMPSAIAGGARDESHIGGPYLSRQLRNTENQPIEPCRSRPQTATRPPLTGMSDNLRYRSGFGVAVGLNAREQTQALGKGFWISSGLQQPPLSEIKNEAKGANRTQPKNISPTPRQARTDAAVLVGADGLGAKSTGGGTVKAMAAMFDSAVGVPATESKPSTPVPLGQARDTPRTPNSISKYMTNNSPKPRTATPSPHCTPRILLSPPKDTNEVSMRDLAREQRRQRLSRSEGRNNFSGNAPLFTVRGREGARSVDGSKNTIDIHLQDASAKNAKGRNGFELRSGSYDADTNKGPKEEQRGRSLVSDRVRLTEELFGSTYTPARSSPPLARRGIEIPRTAGQHAVSPVLQAQLRDLRQQLEAKSAECASWKKRAETAERAVAELDCYASKLYMVDGDMGSEDDETDSSSGSDSSNMTVVVHSRMSNDSVLRVLI
ncbi:RhoGAP [Grosmannia clavigera kw1407]|uniref:RhoGAP n=1 Tax=Grosmannia clavigera (strain kw1407 / UAMH 11150) TaxID=655863 RepID=F0XE95_GROCL|nr:RhoGAP [Grosmannia clavigera kw1407]EFX03761.1 RhoGAP [Grosmannia clavigera kw1407]